MSEQLFGRPTHAERQAPNVPRVAPSVAPEQEGKPLPHPGGIPDAAVYLPEGIRERMLETAERQAREGGPHGHRHPRFGVLYDSLGTQVAWKHVVDYMATGTITPSTSAQVSTPVTLPAFARQMRLDRFPGALQAFLCIRLFAYSASGSTATGALTFVFYDGMGNPLPLGVYSATNPYDGIMDTALLSPSPITDPTNLTLGNLAVTMTNGGAPVALAWQMGFSVAYLLPSVQEETLPHANDRVTHASHAHDSN